MQPFCFGVKHSRENRPVAFQPTRRSRSIFSHRHCYENIPSPEWTGEILLQILICGCNTKHREILHRASQNEIADSQFGLFCQLTPPSRSFNSLSSVIYKPKFGVVAGCLNSIFCLSFIQLLSTSKLTPCHQHRGITCPKWNKSGVARGWAQQASVHGTRLGKSPRASASIPQCTQELEIPFPYIGAHLNLF